jgi:diguanylate cyclase (GGDEF)-like protein/putative nucleotidyltransferase with HDIG domain
MIDMSDYSRAASAYWCAALCAGATACAWALFCCLSFTGMQGLQFLALASFVVLANSLPIRIPHNVAGNTLGAAFIFLGAIVLGTPAALLLGAFSALLTSLRSTQRASSWLAAPAMMSVTTLLAAQTFYGTLDVYAGIRMQPVGLAGLTFDQLLLPLAAMACVQFFVNGLFVATLNALKRRRSLWHYWRDGYLWTVWTFFAAAVLTALLYQAVLSFGLLYVLLSVPVIAATFATYKIYFERVNERTREAAELARLHLATVEALATAIDAKDQTTHCHVRRVQLYAAGLGRILRLDDEEIEALRAGALLHDIGKLAVPDHILNKPGKLTPAEFDRMKVHTVVGAQILERINFPYPVVPTVRHHHERWDGHGYPDSLQGEAIPLTARVLAVVDCYDSLREDRPFRPGKSRAEASAVLRHESGTRFDPHVVETFLTHLPEFETEIIARGLVQQVCDTEASLCAADAQSYTNQQRVLHTSTPPNYLEQIKNAHREVYALYEIARTFGSSLDIADRAHVLVDKVGHVVPYDTCAVYLFDELKGYAQVAHVAGRHAELLRERCIAPGEGVIGFVLANRRPVNGFDPMLDFSEFKLPDEEHYRSMVALPLVKDERLLGVIAVYSLSFEPYTDDHVRLLDMVARLAADAFATAMTHAEAESNALTDALTGLPNARALHLRFGEEEARARRSGHAFQIVMLDLDEFKQVNDTFGHPTGDQMLREVGRVLQMQLREYDFLARYAGDEFVAIVQELNDEQVRDLRERIERAIARLSLRIPPDKHARVGISVGAARFGTDGETLSQLLVAADQAMYTVKADHRQHRHDAPDTHADLPVSDLTSVAIN